MNLEVVIPQPRLTWQSMMLANWTTRGFLPAHLIRLVLGMVLLLSGCGELNSPRDVVAPSGHDSIVGESVSCSKCLIVIDSIAVFTSTDSATFTLSTRIAYLEQLDLFVVVHFKSQARSASMTGRGGS